MRKITNVFLCGFILIASTNVFASFNTLANIQLYTAKGSYLTIYDAVDSRKVTALFPKGAQFIGYVISGNNRPGYKFLLSRNYNLAGYAKESDITQLALPNYGYDLFQLLLDDYNQMQRIEMGGTFAATFGGNNLDPTILELYVHKTFIMADKATEEQYAKDMYGLWKECNPKADHLTINFVNRSISGSSKTIFKIHDGIITK